MKGRSLPKDIYEESPALISREKTIEFVWKFADDKTRVLIERLAKRELYKRIFEVKLGDLGGLVDYSALRTDLMPENRIDLANELVTFKSVYLVTI